MEFSLGEIYNLIRSLQKVTSKELPIKISFRLYKFLKKCSEEMEILEKSRVQLLDKYSAPYEEGEDKKIPDENKGKFQEEFGTLLNEKVEIEFEPISIEDLGDIVISANDLIPMQKIFKEN